RPITVAPAPSVAFAVAADAAPRVMTFAAASVGWSWYHSTAVALPQPAKRTLNWPPLRLANEYRPVGDVVVEYSSPSALCVNTHSFASGEPPAFVTMPPMCDPPVRLKSADAVTPGVRFTV